MFMSQMKDGEHLKWCSGKERPHPCITSSTYLVIKFSIHYKWWLSQSLKRLNGQAKDPCCLQLVMRPWLRAVISSLYQPLKSLFPQLAFWVVKVSCLNMWLLRLGHKRRQGFLLAPSFRPLTGESWVPYPEDISQTALGKVHIARSLGPMTTDVQLKCLQITATSWPTMNQKHFTKLLPLSDQ